MAPETREHYTLDYCQGACPTQAEGLTKSGRPFYFRARHGWWTLEVGPEGQPANYVKWEGPSEEVAEGEDDTHGWMEPEQVIPLLDKHLAGR